MDKSLDDMIKTTRKRGGGRRRTVRSNVLGNTATNAAKGAAKKAGVAPAVNGNAPLPQQSAQKIIVSGLPLDVDEAQIKELFTTGIGRLTSVQLHFDPRGKWTGSATLIYARKGDGVKAYEMYNNRLIDGKKPMKVELILDPAKLSAPSLVSRVAPAANASGGAPASGVQRAGRPRRARGPRAKKEGRPQKSAEDLDAEMEDYTAATNAPAVPAA